MKVHCLYILLADIHNVLWPKESRHTHQWIMSHISMKYVTPTNESCPTYAWVMSRHRVGSHMSRHTYHITHVTSHTSRHTHPISPDVCTSYITFHAWNAYRILHICGIWLIYTWDMTHLYVWHDSFVCVTWLICMCDMAQTLAAEGCHRTHQCVRYDSYSCMIWLIYMRDMTHLNVGHNSFVRVAWLECCRLPDRVGTGWLRLVDSLKFWVSFAENRLTYRALLQKSPIILRSLLIVATPQRTHWCVRHESNIWVGHDSYTRGTWLICMCDMTHRIYISHMGWLRSVASIKL